MFWLLHLIWLFWATVFFSVWSELRDSLCLQKCKISRCGCSCVSVGWLILCLFLFLSVLRCPLLAAAGQSVPTSDWAGSTRSSLSPSATLSPSALWPLTSGTAAAPTLRVSLLMSSLAQTHSSSVTETHTHTHTHTLACLCPPRVSNPQMKLTHRFLTGSVVWIHSGGVSPGPGKTRHTHLFSLCLFVSRSAPVLPGAYHQGVQMQQQQQYHGYMHQTSMSSVRSVTSPPHSATMVRCCSQQVSRQVSSALLRGRRLVK